MSQYRNANVGIKIFRIILMICGIVFLLNAVIMFISLAIDKSEGVTTIAKITGNKYLFDGGYATMGTVFLIMGVLVIFIERAVKKHFNGDVIIKLKQTGLRLSARVMGVDYNPNIRINGIPRCRLLCTYPNPAGADYIFKTKENIYYDIRNIVKPGDYLDVYVDPKNYKKYYIDWQAALSKNRGMYVEYFNPETPHYNTIEPVSNPYQGSTKYWNDSGYGANDYSKYDSMRSNNSSDNSQM